MMWLHLVFYVMLIGVPWPVTQAQYGSEYFSSGNTYSEGYSRNLGSPLPLHFRDPSNKKQSVDETPSMYPIAKVNWPQKKKSSVTEAAKPPTGSFQNRGQSSPQDLNTSQTPETNPSHPHVAIPSRPHENTPPHPPETNPSRPQETTPPHPHKTNPPHSHVTPHSHNEIIPPRALPYSASGVALIYSLKTGVMCSAVHLKPWLLLTIADCVYRKNPDDLYAQIIKRDGENSIPVILPLKISFYEIHPGFHYADYKHHNLAILAVNSEYNWIVDEFQISLKAEKGADVEPYTTYVNEWDKLVTPHNTSYFLSTEKKSITTNYSACNGRKPDTNFFCVLSEYGSDNYEKMDIGIPLFEAKGTFKVLKGLYSGEDLQKRVMGHMFLSLNDNLSWILGKLREYPHPPVFNIF